MTQRGAEQIENLRDEATCPTCDYSLRGLEGDEVRCPECGLRINLAAYFANEWTGSWYRVPGFNSLLMPVACFLLGCLFVPVFMFLRREGGHSPKWGLVVASLAIIGWALLIWLKRGRLADGRAVQLIFLAHGLTLGYALGLFGFGYGLWLGFTSSFGVMWLGALMFLIASVGLIWICHRGEWYIATCCMRQYLIDHGGIE